MQNSTKLVLTGKLILVQPKMSEILHSSIYLLTTHQPRPKNQISKNLLVVFDRFHSTPDPTHTKNL